MRLRCALCKRSFERAAGHVSRSLKIGAPLYCTRECAGLARRMKNPRTKAQLRAEKKAYDAVYRERNLATIKAKKAARYQANRDPVKEAAVRKKRMHLHVEYCRRPEYKAWKSKYDLRYRAKEYGPFADAYLLLLDLDRELRRQATSYERRVAKGYYTRSSQKRRRELWQAMQRSNWN